MRIFTVVGLLCLITGCTDRLEPNDALRAVCPVSDDYIRTALTVIEADRQAGYSANEAIGAINDSACEEGDAECFECFVAMIGQIYGL